MTGVEKIEAARTAARAELARRHLADLGALAVSGYRRARHSDLLCEHLEAVAMGDIERLVVTMPPGHGKSTSVSRLLPAWFLGHYPRRTVILGSHSAELAEGHSRAARAIVASPEFPFPDVAVAPHSSAVNRWQTTAGGGMIAVGVGGGVTGWRADLAVCDDPISDRDQADSPAYRDRVWRWWQESFLTRLQPGGRIVLLHTRWHPSDCIGMVLDSPGADRWTVLNMPAIAEDENDPLGREPGEPLWPEAFDAEWCERKRLDVGERGWAALYQGRPTPQEGNLFRREWLAGRYDRLPEKLRIVTGVDASFGQGVNSDYSAAVTVASDGSSYYVLDAQKGRWHFAELLEQLRRVNERWHPTEIVVEDVGAGRSALQELRRASDLPTVPVKPDGSKVARAESIAPLLEGGRVLFPAQAPRWRDELIEELASFPAVKHDDCTDALVYALRRLREREGRGGGGVAGVVVHALRPARQSDPERRREQRAREVAVARAEARADQPDDLPWGFPSDD